MKLSWFECRFLANKLQELVDERKVTPSERRHCDNLIPLFKRLAETPHSPDGRERDMDVPLETQLDEKIAELVNLEAEVEKKTDNLDKTIAYLAKDTWAQIYCVLKIFLVFSLLGSVLYTIAYTVPKEWAIWAPIPLASVLAIVELFDKFLSKWFHSHWKNK